MTPPKGRTNNFVVSTPASRNPVSRVLLTLFAGLLIATADAQEVVVSAVRFNNPRPVAGGAPWLEVDVALKANPLAAGRMVNRVRVALTLGFELPAAAGFPRRVEYYRAEAECVALEPGRSDVRFYLPPELVKRDQLHGEPRFWVVELAVAEHPVPTARANFAAALNNPAARGEFLAAAAAAVPAQGGLLLPQYLTPFALEYPRATPSFVRRGALNAHP